MRQKLEALARIVETKVKKNRDDAYYDMVNQYKNSNPWFQKVIKQWTMTTKPNYQIAFWRMKLADNLNYENLNSEQIIKLKKLTQIIEKQL